MTKITFGFVLAPEQKCQGSLSLISQLSFTFKEKKKTRKGEYPGGFLSVEHNKTVFGKCYAKM